MSMLRRRTALLAAAAAAFSPRLVNAAGSTPRLAIVHPSNPISAMAVGGAAQYRAFFGELRRLGYVENQNLLVERWTAEGQAGRYDSLARAIIARKPDVILVAGTGPVTALQTITKTIPIIGIMSDPIALGLAASLARPGGNVTGVAIDAGEVFHGKRLELLLDIAPQAKRVAYLLSAESSDLGMPDSTSNVASRRRVDLFPVRLRGIVPNPAYAQAFDAMARARTDAVLIGSAPAHLTYRATIVPLANFARLPAGYQFREFVELGGLMSYAPSLADLYTRCAGHVDRVLKGAKAGDLPIIQPDKFELFINLKTAKAIGLAVPEAVLVRADEVIE